VIEWTACDGRGSFFLDVADFNFGDNLPYGNAEWV
jgi:hypothetical protein